MRPPRIRSIKPELWRNTQVQSCTRDARLCFIGLISHADDEGRIDGDPALLRSVIFPKDADITIRRFERLLEELAASQDHAGIPLIHRYHVDGFSYIELPGWNHQKINRPTASRLPAYATSLNGHGSISEHLTEPSWSHQ